MQWSVLCLVLPTLLWGGCGGLMLGSSNNDISEQFQPIAHLPTRCLLPLSFEPTPCVTFPSSGVEGAPVWYYDIDLQGCRSTTDYSKCANENRFPTEASCKASCTDQFTECPPGCVLVNDAHRRGSKRCTCDKQTSDPICLQHKETGHCNDLSIQPVERHYFNATENTCQPFQYSRCGGNSNNFGSNIKCRDICMANAQEPKSNFFYWNVFVVLMFLAVFCFIFRDKEFRSEVRGAFVSDVKKLYSSHSKDN